MYESFYARISAPFRRSEALCRAIPLADKALTGLFYVAYPVLLALLFLQGFPADSPLPFNHKLIPVIFAPACGFAVVSMMRKLINAPRPYEKHGIEPLIVKDTVGQSFPSKHVYSSFAIALCWFAHSAVIGATFLALAFPIACLRVIGGVHFPKDVAIGAIIGLAFGAMALVF